MIAISPARLLAASLLFFGCAQVEKHAPVKAAPNRARQLAEILQTSDTTCSPWTGRETDYPGVDSMLCVAPNQVLHIKAPDDAAPEIKVTLQTEAPIQAAPMGATR